MALSTTSGPLAEAIAAAFLAGYSGATAEAYRGDLRQWAQWCGDQGIGLLEAHRAHVDLYLREQEAVHSPSTLARRLSAMSGFYGYALDEGAVTRSPITRVRRPKAADESPTLGLDKVELVTLLQEAAASSGRDDALVCLLALNGLRVSEACSIDIDHLTTSRGHQVVRLHRKGGKTATVPFSPQTAAAVASAVGDRDEGPLLLSRSSRRLDRRDALRIVKRLATKAGIAKTISPHSLRHTFVTLSLDAGVSLRDVQDAAGHADPRTTRRYDRARHNLDRHATYELAAFVTNGTTVR